ncbi:MAG: beta-propeller fold lactonase family protein [Microthrixaceae bacterium]
MLSAVLVFAGPGGRAEAATPPANVYVVTSGLDTITPLPIGTSTPGTGIPTGTAPHFVALTPDGATAFVTNSASASVTPINLTTGTTAANIPVGAEPEGIAVTPDGTKALVVSAGDNQVTPITIQGTTGTPNAPILAGLSPSGIAITPNGQTAYVTNSGSGTVTPIDIGSGTPLAPIPVGLNPKGIAVTPSGATLYVVNAGSGTVTPIATSNNVPGSPITVGPASSPAAPPATTISGQIAIAPDGLLAYVTTPGVNKIIILDLAANNVKAEIPIPAAYPPSSLAVTPNGSTLYVTSQTGNAIIPINTTNHTAGAPITGFTGAVGIAITPDQAPVARLTASASTVPAGTTVTLDASASTVAYGTITGYQFIFGDGTDPVVSTSPVVSHTYASPGMFQAKVYEVGSNGTSYFSVYTGQTMSRNSPQINGLPQDAAVVGITVTGTAIAVRTPIMLVSNFAGGSVTPVALSSTSPPAVSTAVATPAGPAFTAITPDAAAAVVTNFSTGTTTPMSICATSSGGPSVLAGTPLPTGPAPSQVAIAPIPITVTGSQSQWNVYVVNSGANDLRRYILSVDSALCTASLAPPTTLPASIIPVGTTPYGIAIAPDGQTAYVSNSGAASITPINLVTASAGTPIPVGLKPQGLAITPDGKTVYVVNTTSGTVTPVSTETRLPGAPITVGSSPLLVAITSDGATAYVTNSGGPPSVTPIDVATNKAKPAVIMPEGTSPTGVVISPDATTVYVASYSTGSVHMISTADNALVGAPIVGFVGPVGLAITPDQAPVARISASATSVPAGTAVTLDASASTVMFGTISTYQFDFGDGTAPVVTSSPTVTHTYTTPGTYPAVVYELSSGGTGYISSFTGQTYSRYAPRQANGVPQDAAGIFINVTVGAGVAIPRNTPVIYVSNLGNDKITPVALPSSGPPIIGSTIPVGSGPAFSAVTPDGRGLLVSNFIGNTVTPVAICPSGSSVTYTPGSALPTGSGPSQIAVSPTPAAGSTGTAPKWNVYVASSGGSDIRHYVLSLDLGACTASIAASLPIQASIIPVGQAPYGIAITPDGKTAYVSNSGSGTVTPIDLALGQPGVPIPVGQRPQGIAITPDGKTVYVANSGSGTVTPITVATNTPGAPISTGTNPTVIAITPNGGSAFVTNIGSGSVTQIDLARNLAVRTISVPGGQPSGITVTLDGTTAWVSNYTAGTVLPIDVDTGLIGSNSVGGLRQPIGVTSSISP